MKRFISFDTLVAIFTIPIAIFLIIVAYETPRATIPQAIGPHVWPIVLLVLLIIGAIILFFDEMSKKRKALLPTGPSPTKTDMNWFRRPEMVTFLILLALFIYAVILEPVGFIICTSLLVIYVARVLERGHWIRNIVTGLTFSIGVYYIFTKVLNVMLPVGVLG
jgi:putative tricarboxylic transport membrane protein